MGLSALTRKGWQTNPREQGRWNLYASIFGIVVGTIANLMVGEEVLNATTLLLWDLYYYGIFPLVGNYKFPHGIVVGAYTRQEAVTLH